MQIGTRQQLHNIGIIGSGQVARYFAHSFSDAGLHVSWIAGRNLEKVQKLAEEVNTLAIPMKECGQYHADLVICAVNDNSINDVTSGLISCLPGESALVHTSGSQPITTIHPYFKTRGVIYPLQTFNLRDNSYERDIPIIIEADLPSFSDQLTHLSQYLSDNVVVLNYEQRQVLHLSAVIMNNFTNHLATKAFQLLHDHQLDPKLLHPLLQKTTKMILAGDPETIQTGPARRQDSKTLDLHRNLLTSHPGLLALYDQMTKSIQDYYYAHC